ncbi:MAG TPA: dTDP-4-dehydrorhamnose 3,5-epimerase [Longimicrobium sp.]|nr:dTDP-4-dehydrorhamnose 3,5-epimerase [Longimicrobium sp.]
MKVAPTELPEVLLVQPRVLRDERGWFLESWVEDRYRAAGIAGPFVQDNLSRSRRGVVRGLHYQWPHPQGKLVSVPHGAVWDVAVDVRPGSPTFGRWTARVLSARNGRQLWIPPGFAHGFAVLSRSAAVHYRCTDAYHPECETTVLWSDPDLGIAWPVADPLLSARDAAAPRLRDLPADALPGASFSAVPG